MTLDHRLEKVAVLGAGGKMGSGISLLLAREMTMQKLRPENRNKTFQLSLIDLSDNALTGLQKYLVVQSKRFVEKNADRLQPFFAEGTTVETMTESFIAELQSLINPSTELAAAKDSRMVFEAILEKIDLKTSVFKQLKEICGADTYFFSNTSSIPLHELDDRVGLDGRIIGFHFYNPPAVQKLVELILPKKIQPDLPEIARELGKRLRKIIIPSNDIAGFIGNGHFMRDGLHGIAEVERLAAEMPFPEAVYVMNRVSQDLLIRPMGIFQLIDYVGLDIFQSILNIMSPYFPDEHLHSSLIDSLVEQSVKGGQFSDGSQKDGFLKYVDGRPAGVFDPAAGEYRLFSEGNWRENADAYIGELPKSHVSWKTLLKDAAKHTALETYFSDLQEFDTNGAKLAAAYMKRSKAIGELLIAAGVSESAEDVNGVLMNGFFHVYGPINDYTP